MVHGPSERRDASLEISQPCTWTRIPGDLLVMRANRRKQSLAGRDIVSQQSAEEALRDEAVAKADVSVAMSEKRVPKPNSWTPKRSSGSRKPC
jgi:hypothetical protein